MLPENLLGIDPATQCGWATLFYAGTWDLRTKSGESVGMKWLRFKAELSQTCRLLPIKVIAYERPGGQHVGPMLHQAELIGVLKLFAEERGIEYRAYSAAQIKKFATGKGNANKEAMMAACVTRLGFEPRDNNEADAMWIFELLKSDLNI